MTALRLLLDQMIDDDVAADLRVAGHQPVEYLGTLSLEPFLGPFILPHNLPLFPTPKHGPLPE